MSRHNIRSTGKSGKMLHILLFSCLISLPLTFGSKNDKGRIQFEPRESWGYVDVRKEAHMFYWLYEASQGNSVPLILWLQGGPGGSSTGFGNFAEIGPLDENLQPRNTTWLSAASLLFVDNPVGSGFSYVDNPSAYTTDVNMIAADMLVLLKHFFMTSDSGKKYQNIPFFIFCESYGGKMTAAISDVLYQAVLRKEINCNFKGLALGDSWISPVDSTNSWAPYLYVNSLVDLNGMNKIASSTEKVANLCSAGHWSNATSEWGNAQDVLEGITHGVNFYNIQDWGASEPSLNNRYKQQSAFDRLKDRMLNKLHADKLTELMNGPIREKLKVIPKNVVWGAQSGAVFTHMAEDFMKPVIDTVNRLIQNTSLYVVVYTGQLDLIVSTPGTEVWIQQLDIYKTFSAANRKFILDPVSKLTSGFVKTYKKFSIYWVLGAGHMVPQDNGSTALLMVKQILSYPN